MVNNRNTFIRSLLIFWKKKRNFSIIECLIENENGSDINKVNNKGEMHIFKLCKLNNKYIIAYFIQHGTKVNVKNKNGITPLDIAL